MKNSLLLVGLVVVLSAVGFASYRFERESAIKPTPSRFSMMPASQKADFLQDVNSDCTWNGINLFGKVQFVDAFPDIKIQWVTAFPDLKVQWVTAFPDDCGEWQEVTAFPDFKVQVVTAFPDVEVQEVTAFPGL